MEPEAAFVRAFIKREKWARYLQLLADRKRRAEILIRFNHKLDYEAALAEEVPEEQDYPEALEALLRARGAPATCHVMVSGLRIDGREAPLREALDTVCLHEYGSVLVCIPGHLAFYRPEAPGRGVILAKA